MRRRNRCAGCERPKSRVFRTIERMGASGGHRVFASGNDCHARTYRCQKCWAARRARAAIVLAVRLAFDGRSIRSAISHSDRRCDRGSADPFDKTPNQLETACSDALEDGRQAERNAANQCRGNWYGPVTLGSASQAYKGFDVEGLREEIEQLHVGDLVSHRWCALAFLPFG
jgi:hypothetical protein